MSKFNCFTRQADGTLANPDWLMAHMHGSTTFWLPRPWWLGGIAGLVHLPFFNEMTVMIGPDAPYPVTKEWVIDVLDNVTVDGAFMMPSMVRDLCLEDHGLGLLRQLSYVSWAGATLDTWAGDLLTQHTTLLPCIGSTEMSLLPLRQVDDPAEWEYYRFDAKMGYRMEPFGDGGGLYELVIERRPECRPYQGVFVMFPHLDTYRTSDLYTAHPAQPDMWLLRRRADDMFTLKWQTRVRSAATESELERHPRISRAMVGGQGREEPYIIAELSPAPQANGHTNGVAHEESLADEVWAVVSEVNDRMLPEVKIPRKHVIVADPKKPLKRLLKGTLNRPVINEAYKDEIERLYVR